jgi:hypothetical protein
MATIIWLLILFVVLTFLYGVGWEPPFGGD